MTENILEMVKRVARLRHEVKAGNLHRMQLLAIWETENAPMLDFMSKVSKELAEAEAALRDEALKVYQETGSKTPGPGLGIRVRDKLEYDPKLASLWGYEHGIGMKLDITTFEKIAKGAKLDFVTITQEAQATIAQDLETVLKE